VLLNKNWEKGAYLKIIHPKDVIFLSFKHISKLNNTVDGKESLHISKIYIS
jgi:hypothetical protein